MGQADSQLSLFLFKTVNQLIKFLRDRFWDSLDFPNPNVAVKVPIMPIPTILITVAIPVVLAPKIFPSNTLTLLMQIMHIANFSLRFFIARERG